MKITGNLANCDGSIHPYLDRLNSSITCDKLLSLKSKTAAVTTVSWIQDKIEKNSWTRKPPGDYCGHLYDGL